MKRCLFLLLCLGLLAPAAVAQDDCAVAVAVGDGINPSPPAGVDGMTYDNTGNTASADASPGCWTFSPTPGPIADMWFVYVASVTGSTMFSVCDPPAFATAGTLTDTRLAVYDGSGGCGALTELGCDDDTCGPSGFQSTATVPTTAGGVYFVRVDGWDVSTTTVGTFYLTVSPILPAGNDDCTTAIGISDGVNPSPPAGVSGMTFSNLGATPPDPGPAVPAFPCGLDGHADVWFVYVASMTGTTNFATCTPPGFAAGTNPDTIIEVFDGSAGCPPGASLGCDDDGCGTLMSSVTVSTTAGSPYLVRVGTWAGTPDGTFYLTVSAILPATNDDCTTAIAIGDGINPSPPLGVSGMTFTNVGATPPDPGPAVPPFPCGIDGHADVWFVYLASAGSTNFTTCTPPGFAAGTHFDTIIEVFDGSAGCPPGASLGCDDDGCNTSPGFNSTITVATVVGAPYIVRVGSWSGVPEGSFYLTVTAVTPPANDGCLGALPLSLGPNGPFDNTFATNSVTPSCGIVNYDLWFSYTSTCAGPVTFDTGCTGGPHDTMMAVYDASGCPGVELGCSDGCPGGTIVASSVTVSGPAGSTYFVQVGSWSTFGGPPFPVNVTEGGVFTLTGSNPPPPAGFHSIQLNWTGGPPSGTASLVATGNAGAFPAGWFFGIDPTIAEVSAFLADPAFNSFPLDACGSFQLGPFFIPFGFPFAGIPFYMVSLGTPFGGITPTVVSNPTTVTIL
jgi:hypothetical protein